MRLRPLRLSVLFVLATAAVPAGASPSAPPLPVAPGDPARLAAVERCPTFHWGADSSAGGFELAVFGLAEGGAAAGEPGEGRPPVLRELLPGAARGWTPSLDRCLPPGRYGWVIRARGDAESGPWSEPRFFAVTGVPTGEEVARAVEVLERYLLAGGNVAVELPATGTGGARGPARSVGEKTAPADSRRTTGALATPDLTAFRATVAATTGVTFGAFGTSNSSGDGSAGVVGRSTAASGDVAGVVGEAASATGAAGVFDNTAGGDVLRGLAGGVEVFVVQGDGEVVATGFVGDGSGLTGVAADTAATATTADSATTATTADSATTATTADSATTAATATTAGQLAADGSDCAAGEAAAGTDAAGNAQGCFDVATQGELDALPTHSHSGEVVDSHRIQVFGHVGHSAFSINSTDYVAVPGTTSAIDSPFPAAAAGTTRLWRVETSFAVFHDRVITLRLHDPANSHTIWEQSFTGGHAPNSWWSWGRSAQFSLDVMAVQGWKRQYELQIKSSDTETAFLGSVWVVAEDVEP